MVCQPGTLGVVFAEYYLWQILKEILFYTAADSGAQPQGYHSCPLTMEKYAIGCYSIRCVSLDIKLLTPRRHHIIGCQWFPLMRMGDCLPSHLIPIGRPHPHGNSDTVKGFVALTGHSITKAVCITSFQ
jgi:hypothetical protein